MQICGEHTATFFFIIILISYTSVIKIKEHLLSLCYEKVLFLDYIDESLL